MKIIQNHETVQLTKEEIKLLNDAVELVAHIYTEATDNELERTADAAETAMSCLWDWIESEEKDED